MKIVKESLDDYLKPKSKAEILSSIGGREDATFKPTKKSQLGTSLIGEFQASYDDLVKLFGPPSDYADGEKVRYMWGLEDDKGKVFTIYDWKMYDIDVAKLPSYKWHIGGNASTNYFGIPGIDEQLPPEARDLVRYVYKNTLK